MSNVNSNRLTVLAADIRAAHEAITRTTLEVAERVVAAGHLLIEAKAALPHGAWDRWLSTQAGLSARTARRYMQIARSGLKTATVADLGIRGATERVLKAAPAANSDLDSDPAYLAWRDEITAWLDTAPSQAARNEVLRHMREQVQAERFAAELCDKLKPGELDTVLGWLERTDPKQVIKVLKAKMAKEVRP